MAKAVLRGRASLGSLKALIPALLKSSLLKTLPFKHDFGIFLSECDVILGIMVDWLVLVLGLNYFSIAELFRGDVEVGK